MDEQELKQKLQQLDDYESQMKQAIEALKQGIEDEIYDSYPTPVKVTASDYEIRFHIQGIETLIGHQIAISFSWYNPDKEPDVRLSNSSGLEIGGRGIKTISKLLDSIFQNSERIKESIVAFSKNYREIHDLYFQLKCEIDDENREALRQEEERKFNLAVKELIPGNALYYEGEDVYCVIEKVTPKRIYYKVVSSYEDYQTKERKYRAYRELHMPKDIAVHNISNNRCKIVPASEVPQY